MRPEQKSQLLLGVTRSKAKMFEYGIPEKHHIKITQDPARLFTLSIGVLGDLAAAINREGLDSDLLLEMRANLLFSARFFDSYIQSKLNEILDPYLVLIGSASYYLCDLPGSASVLANSIDRGCPDLDTHFDGTEGPFGKSIDEISKWICQFFKKGYGEATLLGLATKLRNTAYQFGTPRQLLFGDVIAAVLRKKLENSAWQALPSYSGLSQDKWLLALPTSAGKTKATELILRSAFLADRVSLAIIIAPFRALCHEIKNSLVEAFHNEPTIVDELSDVLQTDFKITEFLGHQQILVVTPEKLIYVLRHAPDLAAHVGLLVFAFHDSQRDPEGADFCGHQ